MMKALITKASIKTGEFPFENLPFRQVDIGAQIRMIFHARVIIVFNCFTFFSEYKDGYLELLRRRFGTKRVNANLVYQEYIHDKDHVHMNSTQWETLTDFVKWLGREGNYCMISFRP